MLLHILKDDEWDDITLEAVLEASPFKSLWGTEREQNDEADEYYARTGEWEYDHV